MARDDHGACVNCGFDLNGERVYDTFFKKYGDKAKAQAAASMYGCKEGYGRWGKAIYVKDYAEDGKKDSYYKCPSCGQLCYTQIKEDQADGPS